MKDILIEAAPLFDRLTERFGIANVIIAGGAIRDTLLEKPIKDVDFFVRANITTPDIFYLSCNTGESFKFVREGEEYDDANLIVYSSQPDKRFQVIFISDKKTVEEYVEDFDLSICKCYYKHGYGIVTHPEFDKTVEDKIIRCDRDTTYERRKMIVGKFPDYGLEVSPLYGKGRPKKKKFRSVSS